ncbi:hypothetical protein ABE078_24460 [Priestia megaterium]
MAIPIFFIHTGNPKYLEYALKQTKLYNPESTIYLIGDETNNTYDFIQHVNIKEFIESARHFRKIYQHMSSNPYEYELFCFERWFILKDFIKKEGICGNFLYLDSDVLLYSNATEKGNFLEKYDMTVSNYHGPQYTFFRNIGVLESLIDFIMELYTKRERLEYLYNRYEEFKTSNKPGGNCDMTAFGLFNKEKKKKILDLYEVINEEVYIHNFNVETKFVNKDSVVRIFWKDGEPYVKSIKSSAYIRVNAIHFQGSAKLLMHKFYLGDVSKAEKVMSNIKGSLRYELRKLAKKLI